MPDTARRTALAFAITVGLAASASAASPPARPWMDRSLSVDRRAELVVAAMTDDEKFRLIRSDFGLASDKHGVPEGAVSGAGYVPGLFTPSPASVSLMAARPPPPASTPPWHTPVVA